MTLAVCTAFFLDKFTIKSEKWWNYLLIYDKITIIFIKKPKFIQEISRDGGMVLWNMNMMRRILKGVQI